MSRQHSKYDSHPSTIHEAGRRRGPGCLGSIMLAGTMFVSGVVAERSGMIDQGIVAAKTIITGQDKFDSPVPPSMVPIPERSASPEVGGLTPSPDSLTFTANQRTLLNIAAANFVLQEMDNAQASNTEPNIDDASQVMVYSYKDDTGSEVQLRIARTSDERVGTFYQTTLETSTVRREATILAADYKPTGNDRFQDDVRTTIGAYTRDVLSVREATDQVIDASFQPQTFGLAAIVDVIPNSSGSMAITVTNSDEAFDLAIRAFTDQ